MVALLLVVVVIVSGFVVLGMSGRDTAAYTLFLAGPLVSTIIGDLVARQVHDVKEVAQTVEKQTNGLLTAKFEDLHHALDEQTEKLEQTVRPATAGGRPPGRPAGSLPTQPGPSAEHAPPREDPDEPVGAQLVR